MWLLMTGFLAASFAAKVERGCCLLAALGGKSPTKDPRPGKFRRLGVKTVSGQSRGDAPWIRPRPLIGRQLLKPLETSFRVNASQEEVDD
jgi:hypothetical protein